MLFLNVLTKMKIERTLECISVQKHSQNNIKRTLLDCFCEKLKMLRFSGSGKGPDFPAI